MAPVLTTAWLLLSQTFGEISGGVRDPSGSAVVGRQQNDAEKDELYK